MISKVSSMITPGKEDGNKELTQWLSGEMNEEMRREKGMVGSLWSWNRLAATGEVGETRGGDSQSDVRTGLCGPIKTIDVHTLDMGYGMVSLGTGRVWQDNNKYNKITLFVGKH